MTEKPCVTLAKLQALLTYEPATGVFKWRERRGNAAAGSAAGTKCRGYICIRIDTRRYAAHRLAWFYMTGDWPAAEVDHRDGRPSNNRWDNLRPATRRQNMANRRTCRVGLKGVSFDKDRGTYRAIIRNNGRYVHLGRFKTEAEAHAEYVRAAVACHGEFARAS